MPADAEPGAGATERAAGELGPPVGDDLDQRDAGLAVGRRDVVFEEVGHGGGVLLPGPGAGEAEAAFGDPYAPLELAEKRLADGVLTLVFRKKEGA